MKIKNILLAILLTFSFSFAIEEANIQKDATIKLEKIMDIIKTNKQHNKSDLSEVFVVLDDFFDLNLMTRVSLGKDQWNALNDAQKDNFSTVFIQKLKSEYAKKMQLYTDEKIEILNPEKTNNNRVFLPLQISAIDGEIYNVLFKFYDTKSPNGWRVYDVDILGVSIIQTYRSQLDGVLKRGSFEDLMKRIDTLDSNVTKEK
ncbi:MAG: ABC transporter substrate-binding protein [Campylobacteraceae bacterium]